MRSFSVIRLVLYQSLAKQTQAAFLRTVFCSNKFFCTCFGNCKTLSGTYYNRETNFNSKVDYTKALPEAPSLLEWNNLFEWQKHLYDKDEKFSINDELTSFLDPDSLRWRIAEYWFKEIDTKEWFDIELQGSLLRFPFTQEDFDFPNQKLIRVAIQRDLMPPVYGGFLKASEDILIRSKHRRMFVEHMYPKYTGPVNIELHCVAQLFYLCDPNIKEDIAIVKQLENLRGVYSKSGKATFVHQLDAFKWNKILFENRYVKEKLKVDFKTANFEKFPLIIQQILRIYYDLGSVSNDTIKGEDEELVEIPTIEDGILKKAIIWRLAGRIPENIKNAGENEYYDLSINDGNYHKLWERCYRKVRSFDPTHKNKIFDVLSTETLLFFCVEELNGVDLVLTKKTLRREIFIPDDLTPYHREIILGGENILLNHYRDMQITDKTLWDMVANIKKYHTSISSSALLTLVNLIIPLEKIPLIPAFSESAYPFDTILDSLPTFPGKQYYPGTFEVAMEYFLMHHSPLNKNEGQTCQDIEIDRQRYIEAGTPTWETKRYETEWDPVDSYPYIELLRFYCIITTRENTEIPIFKELKSRLAEVTTHSEEWDTKQLKKYKASANHYKYGSILPHLSVFPTAAKSENYGNPGSIDIGEFVHISSAKATSFNTMINEFVVWMTFPFLVDIDGFTVALNTEYKTVKEKYEKALEQVREPFALSGAPQVPNREPRTYLIQTTDMKPEEQLDPRTTLVSHFTPYKKSIWIVDAIKGIALLISFSQFERQLLDTNERFICPSTDKLNSNLKSKNPKNSKNPKLYKSKNVYENISNREDNKLKEREKLSLDRTIHDNEELFDSIVNVLMENGPSENKLYKEEMLEKDGKNNENKKDKNDNNFGIRKLSLFKLSFKDISAEDITRLEKKYKLIIDIVDKDVIATRLNPHELDDDYRAWSPILLRQTRHLYAYLREPNQVFTPSYHRIWKETHLTPTNISKFLPSSAVHSRYMRSLSDMKDIISHEELLQIQADILYKARKAREQKKKHAPHSNISSIYNNIRYLSIFILLFICLI